MLPFVNHRLQSIWVWSAPVSVGVYATVTGFLPPIPLPELVV